MSVSHTRSLHSAACPIDLRSRARPVLKTTIQQQLQCAARLIHESGSSEQPREQAPALNRRAAILSTGSAAAASLCWPGRSDAFEPQAQSKGSNIQSRLFDHEYFACCKLSASLDCSERGLVSESRSAYTRIHTQQWSALHCLATSHSTNCILPHIC